MKLIILIAFLLFDNGLRIDYVAEHRIDNFNINSKRIAINYYDPISFYNHKPQIGIEAISFNYNGVAYTFTNEENKNKFIEKFKDLEPRFGGWCAYSISEGKKVDFNPKYYAIIKDSLYLFSTEEKMNLFKKDYEKIQNIAWSEWVKILPTFNPKDSIFRMK